MESVVLLDQAHDAVHVDLGRIRREHGARRRSRELTDRRHPVDGDVSYLADLGRVMREDDRPVDAPQ